jgi:hypothetical protein
LGDLRARGFRSFFGVRECGDEEAGDDGNADDEQKQFDERKADDVTDGTPGMVRDSIQSWLT